MRIFISATAALTFCLAIPKGAAAPAPSPQTTPPSCDASLWQHVYHGTFPTAQDRLKPIENCKAVSGTLHFYAYENDGDAHIRLDLDPEFQNLLNQANSREANMLVVESMCEKKPKQADTIAEGVCRHWKQHLYNKKLNNQHVQVVGAYVEDEEVDHGWREIHPVTSITIIKQ